MNWFKKAGWIYIPSSLAGVILYVITIIFCTTVFIAVDKHAHSNSDALYGIFPYFVCAFVLLFWADSNTCEENIKGLNKNNK
jgi:uncharacterized membrane protein YadS